MQDRASRRPPSEPQPSAHTKVREESLGRAPGRRVGYVAIVGRPNVGKSTLLNRVLGQKLAITSHKAQTTRHSILGIKTLPAGQILFIDTPGIHQRGESALNRYLNRTARSAIAGVDLVLFLVEALRYTAEDEGALRAAAASGAALIAVVNKVDRIREKTRLLPYLRELASRGEFLAIIPVSAAKGDQVDRLLDRVIEALPEGGDVFPEDRLSDRSERFFAAELVREQLTRCYGEELPYRATVEIERFEERGGSYRIHALIWVERPGQRAIVVGHRGEALKAAATRARQEMQKLFGRPVHLKVWVKVKKSWSSDQRALAGLGYGES